MLCQIAVLLSIVFAGAAQSALELARNLEPPQVAVTAGGEFEGWEFWDQHDKLLQEARVEWGRKYLELYEYTDAFADKFMDKQLVEAIAKRDKELFASLFQPVLPGVYRVQLFTPEFCELIQQEMQHHEQSGIPQRRPNGMNRYGSILTDLGFEDVMNDLMRVYLVPMARHLFKDYVGPDDLVHNYPFTVKYKPGSDLKLDSHTDAATVTVNVCLQKQANNTKVLFFSDDQEPTLMASKNKRFVSLSNPGEAIVHLGQLHHGITPVEHERHQLVIWMFGEYDYVRIAKYEKPEADRHAKLYDQFWKQDNQEL